MHVRALCSLFLGPYEENDITLKQLIPDLDSEPKKYQTLREKKKKLGRVYERGDDKSYRTAFNTLVMHATKLRGRGGVYEKALRELKPLLRDLVDELERFTGKLEQLED